MGWMDWIGLDWILLKSLVQLEHLAVLIKVTVSRHEACLHVFYLFAVIGHDSSKQPDAFICKYDFPFSFSHRIVP